MTLDDETPEVRVNALIEWLLWDLHAGLAERDILKLDSEAPWADWPE